MAGNGRQRSVPSSAGSGGAAADPRQISMIEMEVVQGTAPSEGAAETPPFADDPFPRSSGGASSTRRVREGTAAVARSPLLVDSRGHRRPLFSQCVVLSCCIVFVVELGQNGWRVQPFSCPSTCQAFEDHTIVVYDCYRDESRCEANLMLGPSVSVLDAMGAKNSSAIVAGEGWRILACNWLHAGFIHLLLNMLAVINLGFSLERTFGSLRIGLLYVVSGLFGTTTSFVLLPGVLSVGASASVFGLVGACWADVAVNFAARGTLRGSNACSLLVLTAANVLIGLTPWVDNFMHMGGLVAGLVVGTTVFAERTANLATGRLERTRAQLAVASVGGLILVGMLAAAVASTTSTRVQQALRECSFCRHINCVEFALFSEVPWWSCCLVGDPLGALDESPGSPTMSCT